jgi:hypothetical protein
MNLDERMVHPSRRTRPIGALLLAALLAGCGSNGAPESGAPPDPVPGREVRGAAPTGAPSLAVATAPLPVRRSRAATRIEPSVEECIQQNIHDKDFDSLAPRDARRRLRTLQVKADCEERLAAR